MICQLSVSHERAQKSKLISVFQQDDISTVAFSDEI